jgi:hypothetical protein
MTRRANRISSPNEDENNEEIDPPRISPEVLQGIRDPVVQGVRSFIGPFASSSQMLLYVQILRAVQRDCDGLRKENHGLREEVAQLVDELAPSRRRKRRKAGNGRIVSDGHIDLQTKCQQAGKMFFVLYRPWIEDREIFEEGWQTDDEEEEDPEVDAIGAPGRTGADSSEADIRKAEERTRSFMALEAIQIPREYRIVLPEELHERHGEDSVIDVVSGFIQSDINTYGACSYSSPQRWETGGRH